MSSINHSSFQNLSQNQLEGKIPTTFSEISSLDQLDLANSNLSTPILKRSLICIWTCFFTFNATSFQKNKCLWGFPLNLCNENERLPKKGDNFVANNAKEIWLSYVDENMSLMKLGIGIVIRFVGVAIVFIVWERAKY